MLKTKRILAAAVALLAANLANGNVLEKVPADSLVAIKVADLTATSGKVAKLAKDFGIDGFVPPLQDPLGALKQQTNVQKGLRENGELGLVFLKPAEGKREPGIIVLIPTSNFNDLVSNFEGAKVEGGVAEVTMPGERRPSFVGDWGEYAALSPDRDLVAAKPANTLKPAGVVGKDGAKQDFFVYANFAKISPDLMPELEKAITEADRDLDRELGEVPEKWRPVLKTTVGQLFNVAKSFLRDVDSASIGVNISDAGINFSIVSEFKQGSYIGNAVAAFKGTDKPLTVGLPNTKYLVFGGAAMNPAATSQVIEDLTKPIVDELNKVEGQDKAKELTKHLLASIKANKSSVFGMPAPTKIGQDGIFQSVTIYKGAGKELKSAAEVGGQLATDFFAEMKAEQKKANPDATDAQLGNFTITPNARTVEGVAFDTMKVTMPQSPDDPAAMQMDMMMSMFYGGEGLNYTYADMNGDFILAQSASDENIAKFVTAAKANEDSLSKLDHIKVVADELPKTRFFEEYIMLDELVNTGVGVAGTMGMQVPVQLPPDLPPLGITAGAEGTALQINAHLPRKTVQQIIAAAMQVMMQMQGGGGGQL